MLRSKRFFGFVVLATSCGFAVHTTGCGDDDARDTTEDSGTPDAGPAIDSSSADTSTADVDAADAAKPAPVFLDPSEYSDVITLDAAFPYGVTARHVADTSIAYGVKWGTTGPIVTTAPGPTPGAVAVATWTIPTDPKGAATSTSKTAAQTGVPAGIFYGADGFVDLPFGPFALQSYTGSPPLFTGEALLYAPAFDSIVSRAFTNGFYSGVGMTDGTANAIVYSGLSGFSAAADAVTKDNGLWAAPLCAGKLVPTGPCAASHKLFGWTGSSGPVVADTNGNVFVAASLGANGEVYGLSKTQALAATAATKATLATSDALGGTASAAAVAETGATTGWLLTVGFADFTTGAVPAVNGVDYTSSAAGVVKGAHAFASVLTPTAAVQGLALFSDNDGNLWAAVTTATAGSFLELQKKP